MATLDRTAANEYLKLAERHVTEDRLRVYMQLALVARLEREATLVDQAKTLLHQLQETFALELQARNRIARELSGRT
jgi:hypothetical protein